MFAADRGNARLSPMPVLTALQLRGGVRPALHSAHVLANIYGDVCSRDKCRCVRGEIRDQARDFFGLS